MKSPLLLLLVMALLFAGCTKEKEVNAPELPVVLTMDATGVTCDSAVLNGEIVDESNSPVTDRGLCWSNLPDPGLDDSVIHCNSGSRKYSSILSGLSDAQSYYFRAFATNNAGTAFGEEKSFTTPDRFVPFSGKLVSHTECNHYRSDRELMLDDTLSCAEYSFDESTHTLHISHLNAAFNCCPGALSCEISLSNDTIYIREVQEDDMCNCLCLYDINMEIAGLNAQVYYIKFTELYFFLNTPWLEFPVNLATTPEGIYCETRHNGPWILY